MIKIGILGSTGSIGTQTLEVVDANPELKVVAITGHKNIDRIFDQCRRYRPDRVAMMDLEKAAELKCRINDAKLAIEVLAGIEGLIQVASYAPVDVLVTAVVGMVGLEPTIAAIKAGKKIALANKETLVTAGELIMPMAEQYGARIVPVDSEHSAIYQSLANVPKNKIEKVILTASGGPFRGFGKAELANVTKSQALKHPNWSMGGKITIDSATMINKGLELIEAMWLFDLHYDQIQVVVHRQSIIHSAVQFIDGSVIAQLGLPDMKLPIQYALFDGVRTPMAGTRLDLTAVGRLDFEMPDEESFDGLKLCREAIKIGKELPTVLNYANEKAVELFLQDQISFLQITKLIKAAMDQYQNSCYNPAVGLSFALIQQAKDWTQEFIDNYGLT